MMDDESRERWARIAGLTLDEFDRRIAMQAERERLIASVTDEQLEEKYGHVPEGEELEFLRRNMRITLLGLPPDSVRCDDCGGTGDAVRSPAGTIRCRTCGGHGWVSGW